MKVIREPSSDPWSMSATCRECETEVEIGTADLVLTIEESAGDRGERISRSSAWRCPTCGVCNYVSHDKLPGRVRHKLPEPPSDWRDR